MSNRIEWAVISTGFRGAVSVYKDGLGSREEAEAWLTALTLTRKRRDYECFMMTDSIHTKEEMRVVWREKPIWHSGDLPPDPSHDEIRRAVEG